MALSPEEKAKVNRINASKSTGPKSVQGKANSSKNAYKHGLRAESLTLPNEPKEWAVELTREWGDYYQPQSPGRRALVERAVLATVHHKRSQRYLTGALSEQVRRATLEFNVQQEDAARHYLDLLKTQPSVAVRNLNRSAAGCRHLIRELEGLQSELLADGRWVAARCEHMARLLGRRPEDPNDVDAFWIRYHNDAAREPRTPELQAALEMPKVWPVTVLWKTGGIPPTPEQGRQWLGETVSTELATLRRLEEHLRTRFEEPARAAATETAMLLKPEPMALWLRYERMHDGMFHRAYNLLERPEAPRPVAEPDADVESVQDDQEDAPAHLEVESTEEREVGKTLGGGPRASPNRQ